MEEAVQFVSNQKKHYGILHIPDKVENPSVVVVLLTGGPQVRTGAHRIYVQLSRFLSENNWASFRFDFEGMGDSEGEFVGFQHAGPSISAAISFLSKRFKEKPDFIIWSLCDGATASALYAARHKDDIIGQILCNPLAITEEGLARSTMKHYYGKRIFTKDFLRKVFSLELDLRDSAKSLWAVFKGIQIFNNNDKSVSEMGSNLSDKVITSLHIFSGPIRIVLSNEDIVASNFQDEIRRNRSLKNDYKRNKIINYLIDGADHTFVDPLAKRQMFEITLQAVNEMASKDRNKDFCAS